MDKKDFRKILILAVLFLIVIFVYGGYSIWRNSVQLEKMMKSNNITFSRTTSRYGYVTHLNNEYLPYTWNIKAGKDRSLNNIVENSSNVSNLNKFKEAVDKLYMTKTNLFLYLMGISFISLALLALRKKEKTYVYGFAKGVFITVLILFVYADIDSTYNYYRITKDITYYFDRIQIR